MSELPISEEGVAAAENAYFSEVSDVQAMPRAIRAFLEHEGFEVETDYKSLAGRFVQESRLVSPWEPTPTTEEGEG